MISLSSQLPHSMSVLLSSRACPPTFRLLGATNHRGSHLGPCRCRTALGSWWSLPPGMRRVCHLIVTPPRPLARSWVASAGGSRPRCARKGTAWRSCRDTRAPDVPIHLPDIHATVTGYSCPATLSFFLGAASRISKLTGQHPLRHRQAAAGDETSSISRSNTLTMVRPQGLEPRTR